MKKTHQYLDSWSLLAEIPSGNEAHAELLRRAALDICAQDVPGNFVVLSQEDAVAIMLASVISQHTRQMRILFLPNAVLEKCAENLGRYNGAFSVRSLDGLLTEKQNARNWLGKVAFLHVAGVSQAEFCLELLERQLSGQAVVMLETVRPIDLKCEGRLETVVHQHESGIQMLKYCKAAVSNNAIPSDLIAEFWEDDPVKRGILTLMSDNERFQLYFAVRRLLPLNSHLIRFIEIGSFQGGTFYEICRALQRQALLFQGISIEPELDSSLDGVLRLFEGSIVHLRMMSGQAVPMLAGYLEGGVLPELMLIDGDHRYAGVYSDVCNYYPLLAPGGLLLFHDYLPPVNEENQEFIKQRTGGQSGVGEVCRELVEQELGLIPIELPLLYPEDPVQTMAYQPIIPGVFSTLRAYRKPYGHGSRA